MRAPAIDGRHESGCFEEHHGRDRRHVGLGHDRHSGEFGRIVRGEPIRERDSERNPVGQRNRDTKRNRDTNREHDAKRNRDAEPIAERPQPHRGHPDPDPDPEPDAEHNTNTNANADSVALAVPDAGDTATLRSGQAVLRQQRRSRPKGDL